MLDAACYAVVGITAWEGARWLLRRLGQPDKSAFDARADAFLRELRCFECDRRQDDCACQSSPRPSELQP